MLVTLEPLIHWGTITPATDVLLCRGRIMAFRRDGEKCEDPMWTQTVTRYTPQHATSYCVNCLEMLMNKAPEIMALGRKEATCFTAVNTQSPERAATNHLKSSDVYGQTGNRALDLPSGTEASHTVMADDEWKAASGILSDRALIVSIDRTVRIIIFLQRSSHVRLNAALRKHFVYIINLHSVLTNFQTSLSLDGACDAPAIENIEAQYANYASDSDTTTTSPSSNKTSTCNASSDSSRNSSSPVMQGSRNLHESFTQMITMLHQGVTMPGVQYGTSTWATVNDLPSSPVSSSNDRVNHCADTQPTPNLFKSGSKNKLLEGSESHKVFFKTGAANTASTPRQGTIRKFGREIDPNTIIGPRSKFDGTFHDRSMYCEDPDEAEEIREFIKSALQTPPRQKEDAKIKSPSTTAPDHLPEYMSDENWDSTDTEGPGIWEDYILHATKDDASPPRKVKVPPKKRTPPHIKNGKQTAAPKESATGPFFAKRTLMDCPDTISPPTWVAYETRSPSASEIICSCRKPAHTSDLMIAQCSNRDCTIVWYHYDCLDKSGKISCRHGKLICQFCKNETHFRIHDADHGWTVENMVENEVKMPFTGVEMVATMPGQGGGYGIVNPYGLGDGGEEQDLIGPSVYAQGALGALGMLGYEDSSPFMVTEAYKNKHAYAKLREKAAAEEETVADGENEDEDEYYEYEGEYYEEEEQFDEEFAEDRETMNVD